MKKVALSTLASLICVASLNASGYRIPEQSFASVAKAGANMASTYGADAAYYNPANMAFMSDKSHLELALTYINLPKVKYEDFDNPAFNGDSKIEHFLAPTTNYVSPKFHDNFTFGLAITAPSGASKRWNEAYQQTLAQEFSMKVIELNPSVAYKINDVFAVALGGRITFTDGKVANDASGLKKPLSRNMDADSIDYGYNLALAYRPMQNLHLAATYRSKIDLSVTGEATLKAGPLVERLGTGATIPLPAVFNLAASYDFGKTIVEAVYERTFWSKYETLDFFYDKDFTKHPYFASFDLPRPKYWSDADCFRLGITHELNDDITLMAGFAYDKTPIPEKNLGFELPGSNAKIYSLGSSYKINEDLKISLAYLFDQKDSRVVRQDRKRNPLAINGELTNSSAHLLTLSLQYEF